MLCAAPAAKLTVAVPMSTPANGDTTNVKVSGATVVNAPAVPPLTVISLASKPVTPSEKVKVKVILPVATPATLSVMFTNVDAGTGMLADIGAVNVTSDANVAFLSQLPPTPLRSPLMGPGCVCAKETYWTVVSLVNPLMPPTPRGPTTPLRSTGDGLANTVVISAMGTLQLMKMSVPPALPTSLSPFQ